MDELDFEIAFASLMDYRPFPWQRALYQQFIAGKFPATANLPTGLGKTNVMTVWLLALATKPEHLPRRLVYVINRRTVVDQSTRVAELIREKLPQVPVVEQALWALCAVKPSEEEKRQNAQLCPLAVSTLRGQLADNREWSADPARPAIVVGTVDMIGSRLLFSGYGIGFKGRPLHAGFLGQDVLLVHDEAHLEPAFQQLIEAIRDEQKREPTPLGEQYRLRVMSLTATSRGGGTVFELTKEEKAGKVPIVRDRLFAKKGVKPVETDRAKIAAEVGRLALRHKDTGKAVMIFARTIDDVNSVRKVLTEKAKGVKAEQVQTLTGTLRGLERDQLATADPVFARFMPEPKVEPAKGTVYLICTSAGEVGVDISAHHLVSDLTPLDSMAQRFGRVNRRGGGAAEIEVVYESDPDPKKKDDPFDKARWATLARLRELPACKWIADRQEASPHEIGCLIRGLTDEQRVAAFTPEPVILPVSDILFDAWALTTIRGKLPGRPMVEPYLHGISGWEPPETHVGWREEVGVVTERLLEEHKPRDLLEDYPLKPHELLRDNSKRVFDRLQKLKPVAELPIWIVSDDNTVEVTTLATLIEGGKEGIENRTVLLPPAAGGLEGGMLSESSDQANDVADELISETGARRRLRIFSDDKDYDARTEGMRLVRRIDLPTNDEDEEGRSWDWFELPADGDTDGSKSDRKPVSWEVHTKDVRTNAVSYLESLPLSRELKDAIILAAEWHDLGKLRSLFQMILGNTKYPSIRLAKSGKRGGRVPELYRHELGSLVDVLDEQQPYRAQLGKLSLAMQEVVLHLIAVHHGYGRPHFPTEMAFDPEPKGQNVENICAEVTQRFARLQRRYGRWGLAYLESLLRAADYGASAKPSAFMEAEA